ncbi:MAG: hypothetical protein MHPSP_000163 [Paramarteilia canceri]
MSAAEEPGENSDKDNCRDDPIDNEFIPFTCGFSDEEVEKSKGKLFYYTKNHEKAGSKLICVASIPNSVDLKELHKFLKSYISQINHSEHSSTVLTLLCGHSFHLECNDKWRFSKCAICRQNQMPDDIPDNLCQECHSSVGLWLCMICGHIGCNRYLSHHALNHFYTSHHTYALELGTGKVWDYAADNYVHRLVQSHIENKIVEVPPSTASQFEEIEFDLKLETINLEYSCIITKEMEEQRKYFTEIINKLKLDHTNEIDDLILQSEEARKDAKSKVNGNKQNMCEHSKNNSKQIKRLLESEKKLKKELKDLKEENKVIISTTNEVITNLNNNIDLQKNEIEELKNQLTEAYLNLEALNVIKEAGETLEEGSRVTIKNLKSKLN